MDITFVPTVSLGAAEHTAWIFGAGASRAKPYNVPTQFGILRHFAAQHQAGQSKEERERFEEARKRVPGWVGRVQPGRPWTDSKVSLEEVFSHYEMILADREATTPADRREARAALDDLLLALRSATSVFGGTNAEKYRPFERSRRAPAPYAELIERLMTGAGSHLPHGHEVERHTLVTMNYDIILDRCVLQLGKSGLDVEIDYGFPLANERPKVAPGERASDPLGFRLLRVHGGLNWIRCGACQALFTTGEIHARIQPEDRCARCAHDALSHVLVYPSYTRVYTDPVIRLVWGRVREALVRADRWVLIGYSMPPADVHFRALLRGCLALRRNAGKDTEVVLAGRRPAPEENVPYPDELDQAISEYGALFSGHLKVWDATPAGFGDFVRCLVP